jgi:hypothetical protein
MWRLRGEPQKQRLSRRSTHGDVTFAAERLTTTTLFGAFRLDPVTGLQQGHRVGVQWRRGRRQIITPSS